jgi:hypothetical protein
MTGLKIGTLSEGLLINWVLCMNRTFFWALLPRRGLMEFYPQLDFMCAHL